MYKNHPHWNEDDWENPDSGLDTDDSLLERRDVELSTVADVQPSGVTQEEIDDFVKNHPAEVDAGSDTIFGNTSKELGEISSELEMVDGQSKKLQTITKTYVDQQDAITVLSQAAKDAQSTADSAVGDAAEANDQLGNLLDEDSENPLALWRLQEAINDANQAALEAHSAAIDANTSAIEALNQEVARMLPCQVGEENDFIRVDEGPKIVCKGSWTGWIYSMGEASERNVASVTGGGGGTVYVTDNYMNSSSGSVPTSEGGRTYSISRTIDVVFMRVMPGTQTNYRVTTSSDRTLLDRSTWTTLATFTIPEDGVLTGTAKFCFVRRSFLANYHARVTVNGQPVTKSVVIAGAPLFGDGPRWANAVISIPKAKAGDVVTLEAYSSHSDQNNRYVNNAEMNLALITGR